MFREENGYIRSWVSFLGLYYVGLVVDIGEGFVVWVVVGGR